MVLKEAVVKRSPAHAALYVAESDRAPANTGEAADGFTDLCQLQLDHRMAS